MNDLLLFIDICRNKRQFGALDELSAISTAMEDVQVINGLECKVACNSSKVCCIFMLASLHFGFLTFSIYNIIKGIVGARVLVIQLG